MSFTFLEAFRFRKKDSVIHRIDPRTKLYIMLIYSIISLITTNFFYFILLFISILPFFIFSRAIHEFKVYFRSLSFLMFFVFFINIIFFTLDFALSMIMRLLILLAVFLLFFTTTHPDDLAQALSKMKIPFHYAFIISLTTRYIPTLAEESRIIKDAQMSRGVELQNGNIAQLARNFIPLLTPLFVSAIRRANRVAESLESRAFSSSAKRTFLNELKLQKLDYFLIILYTLLFAFTILMIINPNLQFPSLSQILNL